MRILHVNHTAVVSGAEHSLLTLIGVLSERHEVMLAAPDGDLLQRAREIGVPTVVVRGTTASWRLHPLRTPRALAAIVRAGIELRRVTRAHRIAVVHANSLRAGLIAAVARSLGGPPFVVHVRDVVRGGRAAAAVKAVVVRSASAIIAVSDFVAADWDDRGAARAKLARIHNPIDCQRFRPDPGDGRAWREAAGIGLGVPLLAVVGQITPWKRQLLAIEAFGELLSTHPDAHLVVAGEVKFAGHDSGLDNPGYLRLIRASVEQHGLAARVHLLGERGDVESILRAADVLLAPAVDEPFGRAVAEALATGTPAVVSAVGGPVEYLRDGSDGVVARSDDEWPAACRRALELSRDEQGAVQRRARACVMLSKEAHAAAVESLLAAVAS